MIVKFSKDELVKEIESQLKASIGSHPVKYKITVKQHSKRTLDIIVALESIYPPFKKTERFSLITDPESKEIIATGNEIADIEKRLEKATEEIIEKTSRITYILNVLASEEVYWDFTNFLKSIEKGDKK